MRRMRFCPSHFRTVGDERVGVGGADGDGSQPARRCVAVARLSDGPTLAGPLTQRRGYSPSPPQGPGCRVCPTPLGLAASPSAVPAETAPLREADFFNTIKVRFTYIPLCPCLCPFSPGSVPTTSTLHRQQTQRVRAYGTHISNSCYLPLPAGRIVTSPSEGRGRGTTRAPRSPRLRSGPTTAGRPASGRARAPPASCAGRAASPPPSAATCPKYDPLTGEWVWTGRRLRLLRACPRRSRSSRRRSTAARSGSTRRLRIEDEETRAPKRSGGMSTAYLRRLSGSQDLNRSAVSRRHLGSSPPGASSATASGTAVVEAGREEPVPSETTTPMRRCGHSARASRSAISVGLFATRPPSANERPPRRVRGKMDGAAEVASTACHISASLVPASGASAPSSPPSPALRLCRSLRRFTRCPRFAGVAR